MGVEIKSLQRIFQETAARSAGDCPLPEPGRGAPVIEHTKLLTIKPQPEGYDYDLNGNREETERFLKSLSEAVEKGEITQQDANRILKAELN